MAKPEPTPLERRIEQLYTDWDLNRYRDPVRAEQIWATLNDAANEWCLMNGYSFDEGWEAMRRKLDLRMR